jgi:hypothetical protein
MIKLVLCLHLWSTNFDSYLQYVKQYNTLYTDTNIQYNLIQIEGQKKNNL